jgi:hypothetical protein
MLDVAKQWEDIKEFKFISGVSSQESESEFMENEKSLGNTPGFIIGAIIKSGEKSYNSHIKFLHTINSEFNQRVRDENLTLVDLGFLKINLLQSSKQLYDIINKAEDPLPDTSAFVTSVQVEENNSKKYIINEGLQNKIEERFRITYNSIKESLAVVDARIELIQKNSKSINNSSAKKKVRKRINYDSCTLRDNEIWEKGLNHFKKVIERLKEESPGFERACVLEESDGELKWLLTKSHARAFIWVCRNQNFIDPRTPGLAILKILNNTFPGLNIKENSQGEYLPKAPLPNPNYITEFKSILGLK